VFALPVYGDHLYLDIFSQRAEVAASASMLEQLEGRGLATARGQAVEVSMPSGSAFLEGANGHHCRRGAYFSASRAR